MKLASNKSGFTLLEIIIVIIIIGVLASLALPKFFKTIEYSKSTEALNNLVSLRSSVERCAMASTSPASCTISTLDIQDPSGASAAHFTYNLTAVSGAAGIYTYTINAVRNTYDGGAGGTDAVALTVIGGVSITRSGAGNFSGVH